MTERDIELEAHLRALEESHLRAEVRSSPEAMLSLLAEEFVEIGSSGRIFDRAAALEAASSHSVSRSRVDDFVVRPLAGGAVLATYRLSTWSEAAAVPRVTLRSSVWVLRGGRWVLAFHQGTPAASGDTSE